MNEGKQIDRALLKNVLDIFVEIGLKNYENSFEAAMLTDASSYYSGKAIVWVIIHSFPDYMSKAEECLKKEKDRVSYYLRSSSVLKLEKLWHALRYVHADQLLEKEDSGLRILLQNNKVEAISRMYKLFSRLTGGLNQVALVFKQCIIVEGTALAKQAEDAASNKVFVWNLIRLHDKYVTYMKEHFYNHSLFNKVLTEDFLVFCNKGMLARRLLFDKSVVDDNEKNLLTKLKQQCGGQFTSKMEGMVTDLSLAREYQTHFEEYLNSNPHAHPEIDLAVTVLTTGSWPSFKFFDLNLPAEMVKCVEVYKDFYQTKTKNRKLTWIYSLGTCSMPSMASMNLKPWSWLLQHIRLLRYCFSTNQTN